MNSTLKPVTAAVPQGGQSSPAKANIAGVNHAGHPQGAQKGNPQPGNPSLAPVSANMAQMAQNMSHHGNLSLMGQNSVTPSNSAASPSKSASAPLSLVQDKVTSSSQPLALTRTPEKVEASVSQSNGTIDSPLTASGVSNILKAQNPEPEKKQDIAKTSPSTPKPPEKPNSTPSTPQKADSSTAQVLPDSSSHPKVATASEPSEKSPAKPIESKPTAADVAPSQTEAKPVPESANDMQPKDENKEKPVAKVEEPKAEDNIDGAPKVEKAPEVTPSKVEENKAQVDDKKVEEPAKQEVVAKADAEEPKPLTPKENKTATKPTMKLATVTPPVRKRRQVSTNKEGTPAQKAEEGESTPDSRSKRNRTQVQLYQSPTPELAMATKLSASAGRSTPTKQNDDKLIVFYKNEYLAVRNAEGGFYVCQSVQNVYRTTRKIKIRWLSQDKTADPSGETYKPDFYDITDMECVLTTLSLSRAPSGGGSQILTAAEAARAKSILERAIKHEQGQNTTNMELTEEHPDGLDLSLYTDESQLEKKRKRSASKASPKTKAAQNTEEDDEDDEDEDSDTPTPTKRLRTAPKRSPKSARKPKPAKSSNKRKSPGSTPNIAPASKTATAVTEKATSAKTRTPPKRTPSKPVVKEVPVVADKGKTPKRSTRVSETKASPIVPTPSTSTGKSTRTPRKPPAKK